VCTIRQIEERTGADTISAGHRLSQRGPTRSVLDRLHLDIHASGERTDPIEARRQRVDEEARRLAGLGATITGALPEEGLDHYAVGMTDPEGNEFDIN
jgi:Glyoxalase-like domain